MPVISFRSEMTEAPRPSSDAELCRLLLGHDASDLPLPAITDVLGALVALAEGRRCKSVLPLGSTPAELVLVRRGGQVLVSYVVLDGPPALCALDRPVPLRHALTRAAALAELHAAHEADPIVRMLMLDQAARALEVEVSNDVRIPTPVRKSGGAVEPPNPKVPLAFAFDAEIVPQGDATRSNTACSDMHALLFRGAVLMWARGRRVPLVRGPIMLAIIRMVAAARALVEARDDSRATHVRLRAGGFVVGVRLDRDGVVSLHIGDEQRAVTIPELSVEETVLPILRLASDVLRALVSVDRSQARNLRVSALNNEVRSLRKRVKANRPALECVRFDDPDRLRAASALTPTPAPRVGAAPRSLRFERRWDAEVEGLDAASTFLCGDRLVVATPRATVALERDDGQVIWANRDPAIASFMTGTVLVRVRADGSVALCDLRDGEAYAVPTLTPRIGGPMTGLLAGGGSIPPVVILTEGRDKLTAIDLRTGELRWRTTIAGTGSFELRRAGRLLLVTRADASISALDVANGELLWRFARRGARFEFAPAVDGEVVVAASADGVLHGIDLFSGEPRWSRELDDAPSSAPIPAGGLTTIAIGGPRRPSMAAFTAQDGALRWMIPDPGAALGASCMPVDRMLIVNAPAGVSAIALDDGRTLWQRRLSHPVADDVPRRLEAVLRGGALFVPSAEVHVLRPQDGRSIGAPLPCELVPDWMRVDERGWVYVAEESGHLRGLAPRPHLSLVR